MPSGQAAERSPSPASPVLGPHQVGRPYGGWIPTLCHWIAPFWSRRGGLLEAAPPLGSKPKRLQAALRLTSEVVVDGATQPLLASEVSFGRLNRNVPKQELNLVEFSAGKMA